MKIAIYGGSFNPIHLGHTEIIKVLNEKYDFDKILVIPSKISPHKVNNSSVTCEQRLDMCKLSLKMIKNCEVSDIEIKRDGISYTFITLEELKKIYPKSEFYLICGSDMFLSLLKWKKPEKIFELAKIIGFIRDDEDLKVLEDYKLKLELMGAKVEICTAKIPPFSSTMVREAIKNGESFQKYVDKSVMDYISTNNLYRE